MVHIDPFTKKFIVIFLLVIGLLAFKSLFSVKIHSGYQGVVSTFGAVKNETLNEGFHFKSPMDTVIQFEVREIVYQASTVAYSKDQQVITLSLAFNYSLNKANVSRIYKEVGGDVSAKLIEPKVNAITKDVVGKVDAITMISDRGRITAEIYEKIKNSIDPQFINVKEYTIVNIDFEEAYERAITEKTIAQQNAERAKNETIRIEEEARQTVIRANAEAEALKIKAAAISTNSRIVDLEIAKIEADVKLKAVEKGLSITPNVVAGTGNGVLVDARN